MLDSLKKIKSMATSGAGKALDINALDRLGKFVKALNSHTIEVVNPTPEPPLTPFQATFYDPLDPRQTRPDSRGIGAFGKLVEFGDVAIPQDSGLASGALLMIKELSDVKTPHGMGVFRVNDKLNKRFNKMSKLDIALPESVKGKFKDLQARIGNNSFNYHPVGELNRRGGYANYKASEKDIEEIYKKLDKYIVKSKNYGSGELKDKTLNDHPFTKSALEIIKKHSKVNNKSAKYKGGKPPYEAENLEGKVDKINILKADSNAVVHEFFHTLAQHSNEFNSFYKEFQKDYDSLVNDLEPLQIINTVLAEDKKNYPEDTSEKEKTEERWAYVGETFAGGGLAAFPEKLRKYYKSVIE